MYAYPEKAAFNKVLPKNLIYKQAHPSKKVKDLFVSQVKEIVWRYKLSPDTVNLPKMGDYTEIQIFEIQQKGAELAPSVLETIDKAIPYPIIFRLCHDERVKVVAAYKRPAADGTKNWVVDGLFETVWRQDNESVEPLPLALNIKSLYEQIIIPIVGNQPRKEESFAEMIERLDLARKKAHELQLLESRLRKEKQFNRKVEINAEIRTLSAELEMLKR
jgi:hypothetical protein